MGNDETVAGKPSSQARFGLADAEAIAGRYRVVRWLGGGGMGNVYEATDTELNETVALKVLGGGLTEDAIERFRREVRLTRRIRHANVARMFDIGEHRGNRFLTMELVDGWALSRELGTAMPWVKLQPIAQQVCAALAAAHAEGVIHRDLKPHNVLIERVSGRAVVTDFGIARSPSDVVVTQEGQAIGTPGYMAPEQLAGETGDARSDLFALGVMLFELATAKRPWPGKGLIELAQARASMPHRPFTDTDCPPAFIELVERCLEISPRKRPASAEELGAAFARCEAGGATIVDPHAMPSGEQTRVELPKLRHASPELPARPAPRGPSAIAVMPFTAAPEDEYLSEGMVEDLIDTLSTSRTLRVRPAGASAGASTDPVEFGRRLGVQLVVSGSVRRTETGLRVSARLTSVDDAFQIWARRTETTDAAILTLADELATEIARALSTRAVSADRPTDPRAVELYLRARAELRLFWGTHINAAADLLERAVAIDPTSAPIQGAFAFAAAQAWVMSNSDPKLLARARTAMDAARALGNSDSLLASSLLRSNQGDPEGGTADLATALRRSPMSAAAHELAGSRLSDLGQLDEARSHLETAVGLDPGRVLTVTLELARIDMLEGHGARAMARIVPLTTDPKLPIVQVAMMNLMRFGGWMGDLTSMIAKVSASEPPKEESSTAMFGVIARALARGALDDAEWHALAKATSAPDRPQRRAQFGMQLLAELAAALGRPDLAIIGLETALPIGLMDVTYLDRCPLFRDLDRERMRTLRAAVAARGARVLAAFRAASSAS